MVSRHEEPGRCGGGRGSDVLAGKPEHPESSAAAVEEQDFFEVLVCCDRMRLPALLMRDHLERRGISDGGLAAAVCRRMRQLNAIRARNGTLADLPGERPFPPWAREATVRWREERDRRARR